MDLLEKMATYVRVVEAGSLTAAAKHLRLSPAAVSRQMAALEEHLRGRLLLRSTRRLSVTDAGRRYYEHCLRILRAVEEARASASGRTSEGLLRATAPVTFGLMQVVPHVPAVLAAHPGLQLDLSLEDRFIDLALEGADVAVRVGSPPPESAGIICQPLWEFHRVVVASPSYLRRRGTPRTPEALAKHEAIRFISGAAANHWTLRGPTREARVRVEGTFGTNSLAAVLDQALRGAGIALLPDWMVCEHTRCRELRVILPEWRSEPVPVIALYRTEHRGAQRVRAFIDHLRAVYARSPDT